MKFLRAILLHAAMLIALVHMLLPHEHVHTENSPEHISQHRKANSIFDFLTLAFQHEQYDGQMEHFDSSDEIDIDFDLLPLAFQWAIINEVDIDFLFIEERVLHFDRTDHCKTDIHASVKTYRGPPTILV